MAVRIRMKKMGRRHRPYYRICAMDARSPRDGKAIEELGTYDPMIRDKDKRVTMVAARVDYWLSVGAQPTEKCKILIDKYKGKVPEKRIEPRKVPEMIERLSADAARKRQQEAAGTTGPVGPPPTGEGASPAAAKEPAGPPQAASYGGSPEDDKG